MACVSARPYDVIVWGATGYTGSLVCDQLASRKNVTWAIAGRNRSSMESLTATLRHKYHMGDGQPEYFVADIKDQQSMEKMVAHGRCVIAVAGPFIHMGEAALKACIKTGTNYVDATAELLWVEKMREKYHEEAVEKKVKILCSCGFDFVPNDMMMFQLDKYLRETCTAAGSNKQYSYHPRQVTHAFAQSTPMVSGGTALSGLAMMRILPVREVVDYYVSPYAMLSDPELREIDESARAANSFHILPTALPQIRGYCTPFVMSNLMNKYVHWSNATQDWRWGKNLVYHGGEKRSSVWSAYIYAVVIWLQFFLAFAISRMPWTWRYLPQPGKGPEIDPTHAFMTADLVAQVPRTSPPSTALEEEKTVRVSWAYNKGEAYKVAALFLCEAAELMSQETVQLPDVYGVTTPSAALGLPYLMALQSSGIEMNIESNV